MDQHVQDQPIQIDYKTIVDIYLRGLPVGFRHQIVDMVLEARDAYEAQCNRAVVVLSAEAIHRVNCELIFQKTLLEGQLSYSRPRKKPIVFNANEVNIYLFLDTLTMCDAIHLLKEQSIIDEQTAGDMHALRCLRNQVIHKHFPLMEGYRPEESWTREERLEFIKETLIDPQLPFSYYYTFDIDIDGKKTPYIVDTKKLQINLRTLERDRKAAVVSLALMLSCMKAVTPKFPYSEASQ